MSATFEKYEANEWIVQVDGRDVGYLSRERPTRYAAGARKGTVADSSKGWEWTFIADRSADAVTDKHDIPAGMPIAAVKRLVAAHVTP